MPVAPNTSSSMIVRTANPNAVYTIYNLGLNQILRGQDVISAIGNDWDFAGPGAVNFDFFPLGAQLVGTLDLWVKRPTTIVINGQSEPVNQFLVYNIVGNQLTSNSGILGDIGQDWQVQGFGYFFRSNFQAANPPHPDMVTRRVVDGTAQYLAYENVGNRFSGDILEAEVGANWVTAGFGTYTTPNNFAQLMVLNDGAGLMRAYAYRDGSLVNDPGDTVFADVGNGWEVLGFGHFSSEFGLNMIIRNIDPASTNFQQVWIYDVIRTPTGDYAAQLSTEVSPGQTQAGVLGKIGENLTVAGFGPVSGALGPFTDDMVLRDTGTGALLLYGIQDDKLIPSATGVPLTPPPSEPIASTSKVGGIAIDLSGPASGSTSQLVQAMAGFGGGNSAAESLNTAPLGADTSQQTLLTTPQRG